MFLYLNGSGKVIENFGIEVNKNMEVVTGRVIGPPVLKVGASNGQIFRLRVDNDKRQWNLNDKLVVEGQSIERWAVLDFSDSERGFFKLDYRSFISKLMSRCRRMGIRMEEPLLYQPAAMKQLSRSDTLLELLDGTNEEACWRGKGRLQLLVCVMSRRDNGYKHLKWISETKIGLVTQCCLSNLANEAKDQYLANIALKINAKLGGSNTELIDHLPVFENARHAMIVGADVNHPGSRNVTSPSIAAVVATMNWPTATRYAMRVRPQEHRKEKIVDFGDMCLELVDVYAGLNKARPEKIIVFRDGVSDGQFDMVLNEELMDLKRAFQTINYFPSITLIVAQKRHQSRFFPENSNNGNVVPGTVVDKGIVHPFEFDFFLCSHYGSLGTSKPTHYHVLWDEHSFTSDQLQKLIYYMCFTMARCTKPVSLVPPVYYADLVAYRGRLYYEALTEWHSPASVSSSSSLSSSLGLLSLSSINEAFCKLHEEVENTMIFL